VLSTVKGFRKPVPYPGDVVTVRALALVLAAGLLAGAAPARTTTVTSANAASFVYDRWHPEDTIIESSRVLTRGPNSPPVTVSVEATPSGKVADLVATVHNGGTGRIRFPNGATVRFVVTRNGAPWRGAVLRSAGTRLLAAGRDLTLRGTMPLPAPGSYEFTGVLSYAR